MEASYFIAWGTDCAAKARFVLDAHSLTGGNSASQRDVAGARTGPGYLPVELNRGWPTLPLDEMGDPMSTPQRRGSRSPASDGGFSGLFHEAVVKVKTWSLALGFFYVGVALPNTTQI